MLRFLCFFYFFNPLVSFFWILVNNLFSVVFCFFSLFIFLSLFFCWGGLSYIFGCDLISYGLVLLSLWICVLMVLARESIFRLSYFSGFFLFVVIILTIMLYCTFRRVLINWFSWWWARGCSEHVENWNKHIRKKYCSSSWPFTRKSVLLFLVALIVFGNITSEACKRGRGIVALSRVKFQRALQTEHVRRENVLISPVDFVASDTKSQVRPAFKWQAW
jgi:hypothetical protein